jgi:hypothetical protein
MWANKKAMGINTVMATPTVTNTTTVTVMVMVQIKPKDVIKEVFGLP